MKKYANPAAKLVMKKTMEHKDKGTLKRSTSSFVNYLQCTIIRLYNLWFKEHPDPVSPNAKKRTQGDYMKVGKKGSITKKKTNNKRTCN